MSNNILNIILTVVIIPILPTIAVYVVNFLRKKTAEFETKTNNEKVKKFLEITENSIETAVTSISQIYVDELKKTGTFDKTAQAEAFEMAKQKIMQTLSEGAKQVLIEIYGSLEAYIDSRIEYYVRIGKIPFLVQQ